MNSTKFNWILLILFCVLTVIFCIGLIVTANVMSAAVQVSEIRRKNRENKQ